MTRYDTSPAAYLFDMDGLLLDTERVYLEAGLPLLTALSHSEADMHAFFVTLVGASSKVTNDRVTELTGDAAVTADLMARWRDAVAARLDGHVPLRPTVMETLDMLRHRGARMAVVTSTHGAAARHHLQVAGLIDHFALVKGGDEVSANKPDPAPYVETAQSLGVDPAQCAAFEDSDRGITSALRAGCRAVQIPDLRPAHVPLPQLGQHVAADLRTAVSLVDGPPVTTA